jgi:hypothetical protein
MLKSDYSGPPGRAASEREVVMSAPTKPLFGSLALCRGHCTLDELDVALDAQRDAAPAPPLGQILVDMGKLTPEQVDALLKEQTQKIEAVPTPDAPAPIPAARRLPELLGRANGTVARLLPFLHPQRTYALLAILPGLLAVVLAWRLAKNGQWVHGVQGPGWPAFLLLAAAGGWALLGDRPRALSRQEKTALLGLSGLAAALGLWKLFAAPAWAMAMGVGAPLAFLSALALHACVWPMKAVDGDPARTPVARLRTAWAELTGRRAKERAAKVARRDALLKQIGEASLKATSDADPEPVRKARQAVDAPGKPVPGKRERALLRLGRAAADAGLADKTLADELKALDGLLIK